MQDSIFYLIIGILGAGLGFLIRKKHVAIGKASLISFFETAMICVLIFVMSTRIVPFVARYVGFIEAACMPGSPSMDVCLPIIERSTNSTTVVYAFLNGFLVSGTVPILVPLFLGG